MICGCAPLINDIVTDGQNPVTLYSDSGALPYESSFYKRQQQAYPEIGPLSSTLSADEVFRILGDFVRERGEWQEVKVRGSERHLQAVAVTPIFRFRDDVALAVREKSGTVEVHMRSRSRVGKGDLGANAKRIKSFFSLLRGELNKR